MLEAITRLWSVGTQSRAPRLKRQIMLSNQLGLLGPIATVPYQLFYAMYDWSLYWLVFCCNIVIMTAYLAVLPLNHAGHHDAARNLVLTTACTQLVVVTYFIGSGAGVHLFYFTIGGMLALIFYRYRPWMILTLGILVAVLFVICELAFAVGQTPVPMLYRRIMYIGSALGAISLTGAFSYLFRTEIDRVEQDLIDSNRDLKKVSTTDGLTGLMNRRGMDAFLDREWARMRRERHTLSVLMCDVDCFKLYNDHYGHQAGDECLQQVARVFEDAARRPSDLVARYGGEEFVLILPHADETEARFVAERIIESVQALAIEHARSGIASVVTVSVGFSTMTPDMDLSARQLLFAADRALYGAKNAGRNLIAFEPARADDVEVFVP